MTQPGGRKVVCSTACRESAVPNAAVSPAREVHRIAVLNQKGGTGKTTTSVNLAARLAELGRKVLLVDLDAQGNVAVSLGLQARFGLYHLLIDGMSLDQVKVKARPGLHAVISDQTVAAAEIELVNAPDRARLLEKRLEGSIGAYDFVILDCAPSLSLLNQNALMFADHVVIPVSCDYLALVGVRQVLRTIQHVKDVLLHPVEVLGVLPTLYDSRNRISKQAIEALRGHFGERVIDPIRVNARLKEAPSHKQTIFEYAPDSNGAQDYDSMVNWMVARLHEEVRIPASQAVSNG